MKQRADTCVKGSCPQSAEALYMRKTRKVRAAPENPVVMSPTRARQGVISHRMSRVLILSTVGAFIVLALLYLYFFGWPFSGSGLSGSIPNPK